MFEEETFFDMNNESFATFALQSIDCLSSF